jgi:DNA topoisomerase-1
VENTLETAERIKGERELGIDEASGKRIVARMGRYGPMVQIGDANDEEKPRFAKLKSTKSIETIDLDEAMNCSGFQEILASLSRRCNGEYW